MKARLALAAFSAAIIIGCASSATTAPAPLNERGGAAFGVGAPAVAPQPGTAVSGDAAAKGPTTQTGSGTGLGVLFDSNKVLILTAQLQLRSSDPWGIGDKVQQLASGAGGDVVGVTQSGNGDTKSAMVTIRVPNDRFNAVLQQIKGLDGADLQDVRVTGEDKTTDFIDLSARLKAKQDEEARYLTLLAKASTIDDILKIDAVLSNVRTQIEQLQGQVNSLQNRSSMATITVSITTAPLVVAPPDTGWAPQRTFQAALAALTGMLRVFADAAIWALVWSWLPLLGLVAVFVLSRRARSATA